MIHKTLTKTIELGIRPERAFALLRDMERLFRLDPKWEVREVSPVNDPITNGGSVNVELVDDLTEKEYKDQLEVTPSGDRERLEIRYNQGWKKITVIEIRPSGSGSCINLSEAYALPEDVKPGHIEHLSREQTQWLKSIGQYLRLYEKSTLYRLLMRRLMNGIWLTMTPSQRRIALIIIIIQAGTLLAFGLGALLIWLKLLIESVL
ncbi:MAG: hypothetical protein RDV00_05185 [Clostridia bacterium]|nr:hypothetical protein [Clostridia bacterium]MDQ7791506.1 hypothetical protein [Clostridia bacterium]